MQFNQQMKASRKKTSERLPAGIKKILDVLEAFSDILFVCSSGRQIIYFYSSKGCINEEQLSLALFDCPDQNIKEIKKESLPGIINVGSEELNIRYSEITEKDKTYLVGAGSIHQQVKSNSLIWAAWYSKGKVNYSGLIEKLSGYTSDELNSLSGKAFSLLNAEDSEKTKNLITGFVIDRKARDLELLYRITTKGGKQVWIQELVLVDRNPAGEIISYDAALSEQSHLLEEKQNLESMLLEFKQLNNAKDQFISVLSHDLKSPYTSILGFSEILLNESTLSSQERGEYLSYINLSSQNQLKLINNLLEWSRLITGRKQPEPVKVKLLNIINEVIANNTRTILKKNLEVRVSVDNYFYAEADEKLLADVLNIIIANAVKYSFPDKVIEIHANRFMDSRIEIIIKDEGMGISERNKERMLKIDQIFSTSGIGGDRGTGMSLIVAREIIRHHNGELWFYTEEGKGTEFHFTIASAGNSILLIDSDESEKIKISNMLKSSFPGFKLFSEVNSYDALKRIREDIPAVIITSHTLPLMNGLEFLRILKKEDKFAQIPVIAYADVLNQDIMKDYRKMGIANLMDSPVNLKLLRESIEEALK